MANIPAASTSLLAVQNAVAAATDGDTVVVPSGTNSWNGTVSVSKGVTIQGAGSTATVITNSSTVTGGGTPALFSLSDGGNNNLPRRITGIGMKGSLINGDFNKAGKGVFITGWLSQKRVDHCQADDLYSFCYIADSIGVTDHNLIRNVAASFRHVGIGSQQQYSWDNFRPLGFSSLNYFFHENETIVVSGDSLLCDEVEACSYCLRFCNITLNGATGPYPAAGCFPLIDCHGDNSQSTQYSALSTLVYENDITIQSGANNSPMLDFRGGRGEVFNNRVVSSGAGSAAVRFWDENFFYQGQWTPWADLQYLDRTRDVYVWNNTFNGSVVPPNNSGNGGANVIIASVPIQNLDPNKSYGWSSAPTTVVTPPYPHPLVSGTFATSPNVSITSPADGSVYQAGSSVNIVADATDINTAPQSITQVDFYVDGILVGTDNSSPYSRTVTLG